MKIILLLIICLIITNNVFAKSMNMIGQIIVE